MSALKERRPATYADLEALPAHMVGEIAHGVLHMQQRPSPRHGLAAGELFSEVHEPFRRGRGGPGGWLFLPEPELRLGPHVLVAEIAGWRQERLPRLPETSGIAVVPDWLCEVLSPSTARFDRTEKFAFYAAHGVCHCWYVDPDARTLEAYALQEGAFRLLRRFQGSEPVSAAPFDAHTFPLGVLWPPEPAAS
jgi:Uma2 family endonuclease